MDKYIQIPYQQGGDTFEGVDCYGLVKLVLHKEYSLELPSINERVLTKDEKSDNLLTC